MHTVVCVICVCDAVPDKEKLRRSARTRKPPSRFMGWYGLRMYHASVDKQIMEHRSAQPAVVDQSRLNVNQTVMVMDHGDQISPSFVADQGTDQGTVDDVLQPAVVDQSTGDVSETVMVMDHGDQISPSFVADQGTDQGTVDDVLQPAVVDQSTGDVSETVMVMDHGDQISPGSVADGDRDSNELLELECLSDGSEYAPGNEYRRCGILNCDEDIFLACSACPALLCYDHMETRCEEHCRPSLVSEVSSSDSSVSDEHVPLYKTRKRQMRAKPVRHMKSDPSKWQKNKRKCARLCGKEYINSAGKFIPAKSVSTCTCQHGRQKAFRCEEFTEETRAQLFSEYYSSGDYCRQRDFIIRNTKVLRNESGKRKQRLIIFSLPLNGISKRVCKRFFLKTVAVSEKLVWYTLNKANNESISAFYPPDRRGRHEPYNKISEELLEGVRFHIKTFPTMEPHYTRSTTTRQFLGSDLNINKMYELYVQHCKSKGQSFVKRAMYRKVFCDEFNFSFHRPKKDMCGKCDQYEKANEDEKFSLEEGYRQHVARKNEAREEKERDKSLAKQNNSVHAITMDLQSVLTTPCGNVSALYYARKLSVYNFTIYNQATGQGYCMLWNETQGRRGSNEIGSLLYLYLKEHVPADVKHVIVTSDSTVSQNRNQYITSMLLLAVQCLPNIETIEQKFLEPGHTEMEVDSMHSAIDFQRKHLHISSPYEWPVVLQTARRERPYHVHEVECGEFFDLHSLPKSLKAEKSLKDIAWMKVKSVKVTKSKVTEVEVKEAYSDAYVTVKLCNSRCKRKRAESSTQHSDSEISLELLKPAYKQPLPVSKAKKADLMALCRSGVIKPQFHSFYEQMVTSDKITDCLPEPDCTEDLE